MSFGIGSLACYESFDQVGEGTYGYVYKAKDKRNGEHVALKRLIFHRESSGFPLCAVREIKFLKSLQHKNVVQLRDVVTSKGCENLEVSLKNEFKKDKEDEANEKKKEPVQESMILKICGNLFLAFEYVEHDLGGLIDAKYKFNPREIKTIMKQLFEVLDFLSEKKILHRDIKSSNILITNRHQIKLADFGLARSLSSSDGREIRSDLTNNVITMWYKPPELLLGAVKYSHGIDVWSAGCVLAELELGRPFMPGKSEIEQMELICKALGTPNEDLWPGISNMPNHDTLLKTMPKYSNNLRNSSKMSEPVIALLERILVFDPTRRSSAKIILTNKYFNSHPLIPQDPAELEPLNITPGASYHEYKTKLTRRQNEADQRKQAVEQVVNFEQNLASGNNNTSISVGGASTNTATVFNPFLQAPIIGGTVAGATTTTGGSGAASHDVITNNLSILTGGKPTFPVPPKLPPQPPIVPNYLQQPHHATTLPPPPMQPVYPNLHYNNAIPRYPPPPQGIPAVVPPPPPSLITPGVAPVTIPNTSGYNYFQQVGGSGAVPVSSHHQTPYYSNNRQYNSNAGSYHNNNSGSQYPYGGSGRGSGRGGGRGSGSYAPRGGYPSSHQPNYYNHNSNNIPIAIPLNNTHNTPPVTSEIHTQVIENGNNNAVGVVGDKRKLEQS